jgi:D-xylulose reductase
VGIPLEPVPYDVAKGQIKEARIEHVFRYAHVYPRTVDLMSSGMINVKPLITDTFSFAESVKAFDFAVNMPPTSVKVQIEMGGD